MAPNELRVDTARMPLRAHVTTENKMLCCTATELSLKYLLANTIQSFYFKFNFFLFSQARQKVRMVDRGKQEIISLPYSVMTFYKAE